MITQSLFDIIGKLKQGRQNPKIANEAFNDFDLMAKGQIEIICAKVFTASVLKNTFLTRKDLAQEVLYNFYNTINKFDTSLYSSESELWRGLMSWIIQIATWKYLEIKASSKKEAEEMIVLANSYYKQISAKEQEKDEEKEKDKEGSEEKIFIKHRDKIGFTIIDAEQYSEVLHSLPAREQDVLITYMDYYPDYIAREVLSKLSKKYQITHSYAKTIKNRALKIVKKAVLDLSDQNLVKSIKNEKKKKL